MMKLIFISMPESVYGHPLKSFADVSLPTSWATNTWHPYSSSPTLCGVEGDVDISPIHIRVPLGLACKDQPQSEMVKCPLDYSSVNSVESSRHQIFGLSNRYELVWISQIL